MELKEDQKRKYNSLKEIFSDSLKLNYYDDCKLNLIILKYNFEK